MVDRRILQSEVIPSCEKLYSIFETHAEWLTKGKKYTPVETSSLKFKKYDALGTCVPKL